ncbi:MAG: hypothetical protein P8Z38_03425 [Robiginitalea sp.]
MQRSVLKQKTCKNKERRPSGRFLLKWALLLLLLLPLGTRQSHSQKRVTKTLVTRQISSIAIDCNLCYRVVLQTSDANEVSVEAQMDGEYEKGLLVNFREVGNTLFIETRFSPEFRFPNDKLGAHKVVSVSIRVTIPHDKETLLTASSCEVSTSGRYRDLKIVFNDGFCDLHHTAENTEVRTRTAPIVAHLKSGVVEAESRYGAVRLESLPEGDHHLKLYSTRGDISVIDSP